MVVIRYNILFREELQRTADMLTYSSNEASTSLLKLISKERTSFKTIYLLYNMIIIVYNSYIYPCYLPLFIYTE